MPSYARVRSSVAIVAVVVGLCAARAHAVGTVYAIDHLEPGPARLLTFPSNAPAEHVVAESQAVFRGYGMDFDSSATTLYGIASAARQFGTIDQTTGAFTVIGPIPSAGNEIWSDLIITPDNSFYALQCSGLSPEAVNRIYKVNPATGEPTLLSTLDLTAGTVIDIGVDVNGNWYGNDFDRDVLVSIDPFTGVTSDVGPTGVDARSAQGMDFDWSTNTLYATIFTGTGVTLTSLYASIDTTTGNATEIASTTSWQAEMDMAVKAPIPEPGSLTLLGISIVGIATRRRR
jgi:hypothetical protein